MIRRIWAFLRREELKTLREENARLKEELRAWEAFPPCTILESDLACFSCDFRLTVRYSGKMFIPVPWPTSSDAKTPEVRHIFTSFILSRGETENGYHIIFYGAGQLQYPE